ncbi:hypothetical protein RHGRI_029651 [Rhododendron griersonianum]|uniref:Legume lectin domain-containing protein n=1 Tax=Rhododendron griersonianum TaxID=479676 RepID=A0AAV6IR83_9ERIC|nr:hypothetical protein RHGRI_029651 [Rhododendron griersonianum]
MKERQFSSNYFQVFTYNGSTKNLSVFWSYEGNSSSQGNSSLSYTIDLMEILPEWVMVGISASTGEFLEKNKLQSWEFSSSLDTKTTSAMRAKDKILIVVLPVSMGVVIFGAVMLIGSAILRKRRRREETEKTSLTSINDDLERGAGPRRFSYGHLVAATSNFSEERKLGEGGFGCVYKGYLNDLDMAVAVKKISRGSKQGKNEYVTERSWWRQMEDVGPLCGDFVGTYAKHGMNGYSTRYGWRNLSGSRCSGGV